MGRKPLRKIAFAAMCVVIVAGCAANRSDPNKHTSAVDFTRAMRVDQSGAIDKAIEASTNVVVLPTNRNDSRVLEAKWCPRTKDGPRAVKEQYFEFCSLRGGRYSRGFCSTANDPDQVLFAARVDPWTTGCTGEPNMGVKVVVVEPTAGMSSSKYIDELRKLGFETVAERSSNAEAQRVRAERDQRAATAALQAKQGRLPLVRTLGAKICRSESGVTYVGYVDAVTDDKIRILVNQAQIGQTGVRPGGFQPHVLWDYPINWDICS